jgi:uncharacterized protein
VKENSFHEVTDTTGLRPTSERQRFEILDILRGFALYGILIVHTVWFFSGYGYIDPKIRASLTTAGIDSISLNIESFFFVKKFITIFSFLFGIGFSIQLTRVIERNKNFNSFYTRKMIYLFLFGVIHFTFLSYTDILHLYAILGLILIFWHSVSHRRLLFWGICFTLVFPIIILCLIWLLPVISGNSLNVEERFEELLNAAAAQHDSFQNGSYLEIFNTKSAN